MLAGRRASIISASPSLSKSVQSNNTMSTSVKVSDEDNEESLLKLLDNKNKQIHNAVKFQMTSFELFQRYGELFRNHLKDSANDAVILSKLYTAYNESLTNEAEPLISLAKKNAVRFNELFTTIAEVITDFVREYEKTYLEDMSNLRDTYTLTESSIGPYIEARRSYDEAKRQNIDGIVKGKSNDVLVKGQEYQRECINRIRTSEKAYINGCAATSVESCTTVGDSLVSLIDSLEHLHEKVVSIRPQIETLKKEASDDRQTLRTEDSYNLYPQYIDIAESFYNSEERYLSTLTVIDSFKQRISSADSLKLTHTETETIFLNLGTISNNQSDLCRMLKRALDASGNDNLGRDMALAVDSKIKIFEDAYLPYIENYALAEYYFENVRKRKTGAAQVKLFEKTCAESGMNPFLVSKMLEEPCKHMNSTYNYLKGILSKTSRDSPTWQQIDNVVTRLEGTLKKFSEASKDSEYTRSLLKLDDKIDDIESLVEGSRELLKYDTATLDKIENNNSSSNNNSGKKDNNNNNSSNMLAARQEYGMFLFNDVFVLVNAKNRIAAKIPNHLMSIVKLGANDKKQKFRFRLETITAGSLIFALTNEKTYDEWTEALYKAFVARRRSQFFGVHLRDIMSRTEESANLAPYVAQLVMSYIRHNGINSEGVFRISGKATAVNRLRNKINAGKVIYFSDVSVCTTLLKMWLRELPVPLLTFDLYERWTAAGEDAEELRACVNALPECNQCLLYALMKLCKEIADNSDVNKMRSDNLGIVIAPNILYERNAQSDPLRCTKTNGVVSEIINNFDAVFKDFVASHAEKIDHYNKFMEHPQKSTLMISSYEDTSAPASSPSAAAAAPATDEKVTADSKSCTDSTITGIIDPTAPASSAAPIHDVQIPKVIYPAVPGSEIPQNPYAKVLAAVPTAAGNYGPQQLTSSPNMQFVPPSPTGNLISSSSPSSPTASLSGSMAYATFVQPPGTTAHGGLSVSPTVTAISSPSYLHQNLKKPSSGKGGSGSSSEASSSSSSLSRESSLIFRRRVEHKRRGSTTSESAAAAAAAAGEASQSETMSGTSDARSTRSLSHSVAGAKLGKVKKDRANRGSWLLRKKNKGGAAEQEGDDNAPLVIEESGAGSATIPIGEGVNGDDAKLVVSATGSLQDSDIAGKPVTNNDEDDIILTSSAPAEQQQQQQQQQSDNNEMEDKGDDVKDAAGNNNNNEEEDPCVGKEEKKKKKSSKSHHKDEQKRKKRVDDDEDKQVTEEVGTAAAAATTSTGTVDEVKDDKKEKKKKKRKKSESEVVDDSNNTLDS